MHDPQVRHVPEKRRFEIFSGDERFGLAAYSLAEDRWIFTHTEIDEAHEGEGAGSELVRRALDHVRLVGGQVVPLCPFIRGWIERHAEYAELVDTETLARLE